MSEMTRKTVVLHLRQSSMRCLKRIENGDQVSLTLRSRSAVKMNNLRGSRRADPGAAVHSRRRATSERETSGLAAKPSGAGSGQPEPLNTTQVRLSRILRLRDKDRGLPRLAKIARCLSRHGEAAWNSTVGEKRKLLSINIAHRHAVLRLKTLT